MEGRPRIAHPLSSYIEVGKDKSGASRTVLKIPYWARQESQPTIIDDVLMNGNGNGLSGTNGLAVNGGSTSLSSGSSQQSSPGSSVVLPPVGKRKDANGLATGRNGLSSSQDHLRSRRHAPVPQQESVFAAVVAEDDEAGDDSSEFDDFSDGDEEVNIIKVVNGIPSPIPPPPPTTLPPTEEEEAEEAAAAAAEVDVGVTKVKATSSSPERRISPRHGLEYRDREPTPPETGDASPDAVATSATETMSNDHRARSPVDEDLAQATSQENEISEIYYLDNKQHLRPSVGRCRAIYDYEANMYDELSIRAGDVINVHEKQADGWWLGEVGGTVGIFPATYVEEEEEQENR